MFQLLIVDYNQIFGCKNWIGVFKPSNLINSQYPDA